MKKDIKRELKIWLFYFVTAFAAEMAGFLQWLDIRNQAGLMYQVTRAFLDYERDRFSYWLSTFLIISIIRFAFLFLFRKAD